MTDQKPKKIVRYHYPPHKIKEINRTIGYCLERARLNAGLSQTDVSLHLYGNKHSRCRISELETGKKDIDFYQFLLLLELYGQSADYLLGRSVEPIIDIYASHINYIQNSARKYFEPMIGIMCDKMAEYMANVDKDNHYKLIDLAKHIAQLTLSDNQLKNSNPALHQSLLQLAELTRQIQQDEAKKATAITAHLENIKMPENKLLNQPLQYTLPLPKPILTDVVIDDE